MSYRFTTKAESLEVSILSASKAYYAGNSKIADAEFDAMVDELRVLNPNSPVLKQIGSKPEKDSRLQKVTHTIAMGSLDKVNTKEEFEKWCNQTTQNEVMVQEKLDGISVELEYENGRLVCASTRGDGETGEDITHNVKLMQNVFNHLDGGREDGFTGFLRGEIVLSKKAFETHFKTEGYANTRNTVAGLSRKKDTNQAVKLFKVLYFDVLDKNQEFKTEVEKLKFMKNEGLSFVPSKPFLTKDVFEEMNRYETSKREKLDYDIDGLVVKFNDLALQEELGVSSGRPNGQVAWKFAHAQKRSTVESVAWQLGMTGRVTPVAHISPTEIGGVVISKVSLHNLNIFKELNLNPGSTVLVSRRNDVIPYIEKVLVQQAGNYFEIPRVCPICNKNTEIVGEFLFCKNDECGSKKFSDFERWIKVLDMKGLGESFICDLFDNNLAESLADLYRLDIDKLMTIEGYQQKKALNCITAIEKTKEISMVEFFAALNIADIGKTIFTDVEAFGFNTVEKVLSMTEADFLKVPNVGEISAKKAVEGLKKKASVVAELLKVLKIREKKEGKLSGMSFCFTGALAIKRSSAGKIVESLGGTVKSSVSKGLTYLVQANPKSQSTKSKKALELGTKVIGEEEFLALVEFTIEKLNEV